MAFEDWDRQADGHVAMRRLMEYEIATGPGHAILRLRHADSRAGKDRTSETSLQIGMTAPQIRKLALALLKVAETLGQQTPATIQ